MTATVPPTAFQDESLEARYADVKRRVAEAARRAGRRPEDVILVAVTKYAEPDQIRALIQLGHRDFGENRVQQLVQRAPMVEEFLSRHRTLPFSRNPALAVPEPSLLDRTQAARGSDVNVRWHMIGHLQRNKVRKAIEFCRLIHSVDTLRLAEDIQGAAMRRETPVDVLVQVNCSGERSKFGCPIAAASHLAEQVDTMVGVRVRGLMTMAPYSDNPEDARPTFARCRELFEEIRASGVGEGRFDLLSMGMSGDYEVAISEGANIVRVGTSIFGAPKQEIPDDEEEDERGG